MNIRIYALIAATFVALFYAGNFSIAKIITPTAISPFGLTWYRVLFTGVHFWVLSALFGPKEKISLRDFGFFALAALCGMSLNMLTYMWGLSLTSPINAAVLMVTTPIIVLFLSVLLLKEKLLWYRLIGILIGFSGTFLLIAQSTHAAENASNPLMGNLLVFINAFAYSFYVILAKRLTARFHILTILKWLFLFGFIYLTPFCISDALSFNFSTAGIEVIAPFVYVILFATIGTYLLNMFAISQLKPSVVTVFIYLQPFLASFIAIGMGSDQLDWIKIISAILILTGVFLTTLKPGAALKWNAARR